MGSPLIRLCSGKMLLWKPLSQIWRFENFSRGAEPKNPGNNFVVDRHCQSEDEVPVPLLTYLLAGVPNPFPDDVRGLSCETRFDSDRFTGHDPERALEIILEIEIVGIGKGFFRHLDLLYPVNGKGADSFSHVTVAEQVKGTIQSPNLIRVNYSGGGPTGGRCPGSNLCPFPLDRCSLA